MSLTKILIITDALTAPLYNPRVRNLYSYLKNKNVDVTWISEKYQNIPDYFNLKLITIPFYKQKGIIGKFEWVIKNILSLLFDYKNNFFSTEINKKTKNENYDIVFCSTFHSFGLKAAYNISQVKKIPLHVDLRDIAEQCNFNGYTLHKFSYFNFISKYYRKINIKRRNIIIKKANCITSVSPWHINFLKQFNDNVNLIYNGYDENLFYPQKILSKYFDIVYAGKWYGSLMQDPSLIFEALSQLNIPQIRFIWYTNNDVHKDIIKLYNYYNIKKQIIVNNYVSNKNIPNILNESSIVLVMTNKNANGIMTTKFFEALGVEKPILCVRSDEGCLADVIKNTNSGISATNVEEVKEFIIKYYMQWKQQGYTHINVKNKEHFTRQKQAQQFEELFNKVIINYND